MTHDPSWHLLDNDFVGYDDGIAPPQRRMGALGNQCVDVAASPWRASAAHTLVVSQAGLQIANLDRTDPSGYLPGGFPRGDKFNANVFRLPRAGGMPVIRVRCAVRGFEPAATAIYWRLQCLHLLCRHKKVEFPYRYRGLCRRLYREWQGRSSSAEFSLFDPDDPDVECYYGGAPGERVMGGHGILSVAARVRGIAEPLVDYVHVRIEGDNPSASDALAHLAVALAGRNANVVAMIRAIFAHESQGRQFSLKRQGQVKMTFTKKFHPHPPNDPAQPDCPTIFAHPADPPRFPLAAFDFGVGISQYTEVAGQVISEGVAWDWRQNMAKGINLFLRALHAKYSPGITWKSWALKGWAAYNGSGAAAAAYAQALAASPEGQNVSAAVAPPIASLAAEFVPLPEEPSLPSPPAWPPGT